MTHTPQTLTISHVGNYRFLVDFGMPPRLATDEPVPIGEGTGPSPEQLLAAGVVNCLCASLFFALTKYRQDGAGLSAKAEISTCRNDKGRLRIDGIAVTLRLGARDYDADLLARALGQFENFCTVSESVKAGVPVAVSIEDGQGRIIAPDAVEGGAPSKPGAASPEDLVRLFAERANAGDLAGLVDLYEPGATLAAGERLSQGHAGIQEFYRTLLERRKEFPGAEVVQKLTNESVAVTIAQAPGGGLSLEVARRQPDGNWRWVIDQLKLKLPG